MINDDLAEAILSRELNINRFDLTAVGLLEDD